MHKRSVSFYAMGYKGLYVLEQFIREFGSAAVAAVVGAEDRSMGKDYYDEIQLLCGRHGIPFHNRQMMPGGMASDYAFAISWRWMIPAGDTVLIVLHDSILPSYRGFAPLVSMLVNGENRIGVTALIAADEYDCGDILTSSSVEVSYPLKIEEAISRITPCYWDCVQQVYRQVLAGEKPQGIPQDHGAASYSLWLDDEDYFIDWSLDAERVSRFIDAVGFPYKGACTMAGNDLIRVLSAEVVRDVRIENRVAGKVIWMQDGLPVICCGSGLLRVLEARYDGSGESALPFRKFRTRLK